VPPSSRSRFFAAATAASITFAVFGLLASLAPSFLAGTLHDGSHVLAGGMTFVVFATAALTQRLTSSRTPAELLASAIPAMLLGLGLLTLAVWLPHPSLAVFVTGVVVSGIGSGLMFRGAMGTVSALASDEHRAEALAGVFLAAYVGLAVPVIGLGLLTQLLTAQLSLLVFAGLLAAALLLVTPELLGRPPRRLHPHPVLR